MSTSVHCIRFFLADNNKLGVRIDYARHVYNIINTDLMCGFIATRNMFIKDWAHMLEMNRV